MNEYILNAQYETSKSFYNKAVVKVEGENKYLYSYNTLVCKIENNKLFINGWYSSTTARYINEFLQQNGFKSMTKKEMESFKNE